MKQLKTKKQETQQVETPIVSVPKLSKAKIKLSKKYAVALVAIVLIGAAVYFGKGFIVAAIVNGKPISRYAVIASLEKTQGTQALDNLVTEALIKQEVKKAGVVTTKEEIDAELAKIETQLTAQSLTLDQALAKEKITKAELIAQITLQKQLEKMLSKDITVTDEEIKTYIETNKAYLPTDATPEALNAQVKAQLVQQKLSAQYQTWIADIKAKAKINYFVTF